MRYLYLIIALILSLNAAAQKITAGTFINSGKVLHFSRIDYSEHGLGQIRVIMYEDIEKNQDLIANAAKCLNKVSNLYHTYYYFIKLPVGSAQSEGEAALTNFIQYLANDDEYKKLKKKPILYIFSDMDYSAIYKNQKTQPYALEQVLVGVSAKNVCKGLF